LEAAKSMLQGKITTGDFDVFLCHHNTDKPEVKKIAERLKERGILPWLDEWELRPGMPWQRLLEEQIVSIKSVAVFIGKDGIGEWQREELEAFLGQYIERECPVIPVLLPDAPKDAEIPPFLRNRTWVDFRQWDPDPLDRLVWGISGERMLMQP
jgi:TIR domain